MANYSPRTLPNALMEGAPIVRGAMGEGGSLMSGVLQRVRPVLNEVDNVVPVLRSQFGGANAFSGVADNSVDVAVDKAGNRLKWRVDKNAELDALKGGWIPEHGLEGGVPGKAISKAPIKSAADTLVQGAESVLGYGAMGVMATEMAIPAASGAAWMVGLNKTSEWIHKPHDYLNQKKLFGNVTARQALNDGIQLGFSAIQTYGYAKGFFEHLASLKEMYTDITGKDSTNISTIGILTMQLPPVLARSRDHFIKEYGSRGLVQGLGWGLMLRDLMKGHANPKEIAGGRIGFLAGMLPPVVSLGIDAWMGHSGIEVYSGFKKQFESGAALAPNEYAAFILANDSDLAGRRVAKMVAMEIGTESAKKKEHPAKILQDMNSGAYKARIDALIAKDEAIVEEKLALKKKAAEEAKAGTSAVEQKPVSMVDKVAGLKQDRPVMGKFTQKISEEPGMARSVT